MTSLLATYDDLVRCSNVLAEGGCEPEFIRFALNQEACRQKWLQANLECQRLRRELDCALQAKADLEIRLRQARQMQDQERKKRHIAETERNILEKQIGMVRDVLFVECRNKINDEMKERLTFLNNTTLPSRRSSVRLQEQNGCRSDLKLGTISENLNSTESLLSELSYSRSEDDLDVDTLNNINTWKKHKPKFLGEDPVAKRRRSSINKSIEVDGNLSSGGQIIATTTVTVSKGGPMTASSRLETVPSSETRSCFAVPEIMIPSAPPIQKTSTEESDDSMVCEPTNGVNGRSNFCFPSPHTGGIQFDMDRKINTRAHSLCSKTIIKPETCEPCGKKITFGKVALKCVDCRAVCHTTCKDKLPLPCVPAPNTPTSKGLIGSIADFTPATSPMIPALILHCIKEVESRGFTEVGLYRVPGSEKDVKQLKEKFLRGRGAPNLSGVDIAVICGTIKDFLRSLKEPLVTHALWPSFIRTLDIKDASDRKAALYQVISNLPQPNRDTLAYIILHLQRVAGCPECKMPTSNLSKVFGPTLVGYTSDPDPKEIMTQTRMVVSVVEELMNLPSDFWAHYINVETLLPSMKTPEMRNTPSSASLNRNFSSASRFFNTPQGTGRTFRKGQRFFNPIQSSRT